MRVNTSYTWHCPSLVELKFRGLVINEGWTLPKRRISMPLSVTILLVAVIAAKFLFGWNTAWTVGSYFIALVGFVCR